MSKFALERFISGKLSIDKLIVDGVCEFDDFMEMLSNNKRDAKKAASILAIMHDYAENLSLGSGKFNTLTTNKSERVKEYEFKKSDVRIYAIKKDNGAIVIMGGFKNRQTKDIRRFRSIKARYLESL
ncbi:MAG: hypothetical protein V2B15_04640 [Bacteroidota bacterium]